MLKGLAFIIHLLTITSHRTSLSPQKERVSHLISLSDIDDARDLNSVEELNSELGLAPHSDESTSAAIGCWWAREFAHTWRERKRGRDQDVFIIGEYSSSNFWQEWEK